MSSNNSYNNSIFSQFFAPNDSDVQDWAENVFEKIYGNGIVPKYIVRGDSPSADVDYISFWKSVSYMFAYLVVYSREFLSMESNREMLKDYLVGRGMGVCPESTLEELRYIMKNFNDEIRKRGTSSVFEYYSVDSPTITEIAGEFLRLICHDSGDEMVVSMTDNNHFGWCIGRCSPMYRGTGADYQLIKGYEKTIGTPSSAIGLYPTINAGGITTVPNVDYGTEIMQIDTDGSGFGYSGSGVPEKLIVIDHAVNYEITAILRSAGVSGSVVYGWAQILLDQFSNNDNNWTLDTISSPTDPAQYFSFGSFLEMANVVLSADLGMSEGDEYRITIDGEAGDMTVEVSVGSNVLTPNITSPSTYQYSFVAPAFPSVTISALGDVTSNVQMWIDEFDNSSNPNGWSISPPIGFTYTTVFHDSFDAMVTGIGAWNGSHFFIDYTGSQTMSIDPSNTVSKDIYYDPSESLVVPESLIAGISYRVTVSIKTASAIIFVGNTPHPISSDAGSFVPMTFTEMCTWSGGGVPLLQIQALTGVEIADIVVERADTYPVGVFDIDTTTSSSLVVNNIGGGGILSVNTGVSFTVGNTYRCSVFVVGYVDQICTIDFAGGSHSINLSTPHQYFDIVASSSSSVLTISVPDNTGEYQYYTFYSVTITELNVTNAPAKINSLKIERWQPVSNSVVSEITMGVDFFDKDGNHLSSKYIDGNDCTSNTFFSNEMLYRNDTYYQVRGILFGVNEPVRNTEDSFLDIGFGKHIQIPCGATHIVPKIILNYQSGTIGTLDVIDFKVRIADTPYSRGFIQTPNVIQIWAKNNNGSFSTYLTELNTVTHPISYMQTVSIPLLEDFIKRYIIPYNSTVIFNWLGNETVCNVGLLGGSYNRSYNESYN